MDRTLADTLTANLKSAKTEDERSRAQTLAMIAMVDCQCKTGARVKRQGVILAGIGLLLLPVTALLIEGSCAAKTGAGVVTLHHGAAHLAKNAVTGVDAAAGRAALHSIGIIVLR